MTEFDKCLKDLIDARLERDLWKGEVPPRAGPFTTTRERTRPAGARARPKRPHLSHRACGPDGKELAERAA